jgi:hypothetical protein
MFFQRFRKISSAYHQALRLRHIAVVLLKYGYDDLALRLPLPRAARIPFKRVREHQAQMQLLTQPERLRRGWTTTIATCAVKSVWRRTTG